MSKGSEPGARVATGLSMRSTGALSGLLPDVMRSGTGLTQDSLQTRAATVSMHPEPRIERLESVVVRAGGQLEEVTWSVIDGDHLATVQVGTQSGSHALGLRLEQAGVLLSIDGSQALELEDDEWSSVVHELLLAAYSSELQVRRVDGSITAFRASGLESHMADHGRFPDRFRRGSRTPDWSPL